MSRADISRAAPVRLAPAAWQAAEAAHAARVDAATAAHRDRRAAGRAHPVEDFLFRYYANPVGRLRRWHPGAGVVLEGAARGPRADWRFHRTDGDGVVVDLPGFLAARGGAVASVHRLVSATLARPGQLGCFGLHEWAMVYRLPQEEVRHASWPLRLAAGGTDAVVEAHQLRCTHIDAYRFFTPAALPRNAVRPTRETQPDLEQPGCLHAGMDVYKWCYSLAPVVPSELTMDAFDLAREVRTLDMRASPYDLRDLGLEPVRVETAAGRTAYVEAQRGFMLRSNALRRRLIEVIEPLLVSAPPRAPGA